MRRIMVAAAALAVLAAAGWVAQPATSCADAALRAYYDSGAYRAGVQQVADAAWAHVERAIADLGAREDAHLAVVLDCDDTALSNYPALAELGFCADFAGLAARWEAGEAIAIEPIRRLFDALRAHDVEVFFITGRPERFREVTERQLTAAGYEGYAGLFLRPAEFRGSSAEAKSASRAEIEARGYRILANIGDQLADLEGGHAERGFLVPNPFYGSRPRGEGR